MSALAMDHEEQGTCSGSLTRREPLPDTDVQKTTTLQLSLPCEQHHHRVQVDDGGDWPAKRVPGFRSTKTPTHRARTSQTSLRGDLLEPILPVVDGREEVVATEGTTSTPE